MCPPAKKWQIFEDLAAKIQRDLSPSGRVEQHVRVQGVEPGALCEIDIAVTVPEGQFNLFIVIDKQHLSNPAKRRSYCS